MVAKEAEADWVCCMRTFCEIFAEQLSLMTAGTQHEIDTKIESTCSLQHVAPATPNNPLHWP